MSTIENKTIYVPCDCGCCVLEISKWAWSDEDMSYAICVLDSRYDHEANGVWNRIKRAAKALFGKPVHFNDVALEAEQYDLLIEQMVELRDAKVDE